jgi:hypothetical protein
LQSLIIFGTAGVAYANIHNLPAFLPVGYAIILAGFASIGLAIYKISRIRAKERVYARDYLGAGEQVLGEWRYGIWVGFLRRQKILVVLTNQSLMAINQGTGRIFFEARLSDLSAVAKNRRTESHFTHSFSHLETQRGNRSGWVYSDGKPKAGTHIQLAGRTGWYDLRAYEGRSL